MLDLSILPNRSRRLRRDGVSHGSDATMPEFLGTQQHIIPISKGRRMEPLVILGAGEFGREVAWLVDEINRAAPEPKWNLLGFLDDSPNPLAEFSHYPPLLGRPEAYRTLGRPFAVCAVANSGTREALVARLNALGARWATLIHPTAGIGMGTQIGEGSILCRQAMVTVDATIGRHVQLNVNSAVGHGPAATSARLPVCRYLRARRPRAWRLRGHPRVRLAQHGRRGLGPDRAGKPRAAGPPRHDSCQVPGKEFFFRGKCGTRATETSPTVARVARPSYQHELTAHQPTGARCTTDWRSTAGGRAASSAALARLR